MGIPIFKFICCYDADKILISEQWTFSMMNFAWDHLKYKTKIVQLHGIINVELFGPKEITYRPVSDLISTFDPNEIEMQPIRFGDVLFDC